MAIPSIPRSGRSPSVALLLMLLQVAAHAAAPPVPEFDVAYRAWDAVIDIARHNRDASISGECGRTFRPFVIPGLKRQTKPEQDIAAVACVQAARAACTNARLQKTADAVRKCEEFR